MNNNNFCQSCGMPMGDTKDLYGTEADGTKSEDYCHYCYKEGKFTDDLNLEQTIEQCVPFMVKDNEGMTADEAREKMQMFFPTLKRWKNN